MDLHSPPGRRAPLEGYIAVDPFALYYREIGQRKPIVLLHGGPDVDHNYFRSTIRQPALLESLVGRLRVNLTEAGICKAREIEDRLMLETWRVESYNLLPEIQQLAISTLLIHGD